MQTLMVLQMQEKLRKCLLRFSPNDYIHIAEGLEGFPVDDARLRTAQ